MARKIEKMPAGRSKYPWHEWLDGDAWELTRGEGFEPPVLQFARNVYATAQRKGVRVRVTTQGDKVFIQAHLNGAQS